MKYPGNIRGPRIDTGDLVNFSFDGAELTFRLPVVPIDRHNEDIVCRIKDFRKIDTRTWDTDNQNRPCFILTEQAWVFEDSVSLDDIAQFRLFISLGEAEPTQQKQNILLNENTFQEDTLNSLVFSFQEQDDEHKHDKNWPSEKNQYHLKKMPKEYLNWLTFQLSFNDYRLPQPTAIIPINNRFTLMIYIKLDSLHYEGRTNPYSKELLRKFEFDLFDEFLSHIDLKYSPETIAMIKTLKTK